MTDHRTELRRQLVEAAYRQGHNGPGQSLPLLAVRRFGLVAAALLIAGIVAVIVARDAPHAAADVFEFSTDGESLVIEIVGSVDDPQAAAAELEAQGFAVDLTGVPAVPSIVGKIVAASADTEALQTSVNNSRVTELRIPRDEIGTLAIRYGRPARAGEDYEVTESVPRCVELSGELVSEVVSNKIRAQFGPNVRWQEVGSRGRGEITANAVHADADVVDVLPLSPDSVLVIVTDGVSPVPPGMAC